MLFSSHLSAQQLFFNEHVSHKGSLLSSDDISADFAVISDWWTPPICIIRMKARPLKSGFSLLLEKPRKQSVRIQGLWRQKGKFWENIWWKLLHAGLKSCKLFLTSIKRINRLFLCFFQKSEAFGAVVGGVWSDHVYRTCVSLISNACENPPSEHFCSRTVYFLTSVWEVCKNQTAVFHEL